MIRLLVAIGAIVLPSATSLAQSPRTQVRSTPSKPKSPSTSNRLRPVGLGIDHEDRTTAETITALQQAINDVDHMIERAEITSGSLSGAVSLSFQKRMMQACQHSLFTDDLFQSVLRSSDVYHIDEDEKVPYMLTCRSFWQGYLLSLKGSY